MLNKYYILNAQKVVPVTDVLEWGRWFDKAGKKRIVRQTQLKNGKWVSTVFLGLDHGFSLDGKHKPQIFETMVFTTKNQKRILFGKIIDTVGDELDCERYSTWKEAEEGHKLLVNKWKGVK